MLLLLLGAARGRMLLRDVVIFVKRSSDFSVFFLNSTTVKGAKIATHALKYRKRELKVCVSV